MANKFPMKVGILTYHFSDNYGALLQAYALRAFLLREGFDAYFINYHPRYVEEGGAFDAPLNLKYWRKNLTILYLKIAHLRRQILGNKNQRIAFDAFRRDVLAVRETPIETIEGLSNIEMPDVLICGSDQIWNPSVQRGLDPVYFLHFAGAENTYRLSYAASFGRAELDPIYTTEAGTLIKHLNGISVREVSGIAIVRKISGREAVSVPDPTLLLDNFNDLLALAGPTPSDHVFVYALRSTKGIADAAIYASKHLSAPILSPNKITTRWFPIGTTIRLSPAEWLSHIRSARFVISNSFHGVALAIAMRRPFLAVGLPGRKHALSERVVNLLQQLNMQDRMIREIDEALVAQVIETPIDWDEVDKRVAEQRRRGREFLLSNLKAGSTSEQ